MGDCAGHWQWSEVKEGGVRGVCGGGEGRDGKEVKLC